MGEVPDKPQKISFLIAYTPYFFCSTVLYVKVKKTQICTKGPEILGTFKVFICTKNEREYFCISALASEMGQIIKIMAHYHANYN